MVRASFFLLRQFPEAGEIGSCTDRKTSVIEKFCIARNSVLLLEICYCLCAVSDGKPSARFMSILQDTHAPLKEKGENEGIVSQFFPELI